MRRRTAPDAGRANVARAGEMVKKSAKVAAKGSIERLVDRRKRLASTRVWDAALAAAVAPGSTPETRLEAVLVVIDAHLNGIVRCPALWGDTMSAEIIANELLALRAVLLGAEPAWWGGEALSRAKRRRFKTDNGPASNWIGREDFDALVPLLKIAIRAERKRHGVPCKVPVRRTRTRKGGAR